MSVTTLKRRLDRLGNRITLGGWTKQQINEAADEFDSRLIDYFARTAAAQEEPASAPAFSDDGDTQEKGTIH